MIKSLFMVECEIFQNQMGNRKENLLDEKTIMV